MKMKFLLALTMLTLAMCSSAQLGSVTSGAAHLVTITEDQNGQTVDVLQSDDVVVTFVAPSGTGYQWQMDPTDLATAKLESVALKPGLPGGPVKTMFHVQVKQAGTATLVFKFFQAWMKDKPPAKTFSVTLNVHY